MENELHETAGRHEAEIEKLQQQMDQVLFELKEIRTTLAEARGGWRTLLWLGGAVGAFVGLVLTGINR
jgi:chromosome segregation ATPase|tara:strand:- start:399 stop:602 length:204 start_codon:yes stop_codon:yes gene_type:complete